MYIMKKIIIIGSGWASSSFLKNIDTNKYDIEVISPTCYFIYTPLLANTIYNNKLLTENINNLNKLKYKEDEVIDINFNKNKIITRKNFEYQYDYLILAHGSVINTFNIEGVKENCFFIKNPNDTNLIKKKLENLKKNSKIAVIGCGLTGSEIIGNLIDYNKFNIYAIDGLKLPLNTFKLEVSNYVLDFWKENNINTYFNNFVNKIDNENIYFKNEKINYDLAIWCGGIKISPLSLKINNILNLDCKFGIPVNKYLEVENTKNVFAIGDCAYSGFPPTAQVAYQQGKYLSNNFNHNFINKEKFNFINRGQICYIGKGNSIYQNKNFVFKGRLTGYLNNFIHVYNSINFNQAYNFFFN